MSIDERYDRSEIREIGAYTSRIFYRTLLFPIALIMFLLSYFISIKDDRSLAITIYQDKNDRHKLPRREDK